MVGSHDIEKENIDLQIAIETQKTGWKLNTPPSKLEDKEMLSTLLVTPPIKKIDLVWPLGLTVTARNMKGVTIKDALEAIYKQFKKKVRACCIDIISHLQPMRQSGPATTQNIAYTAANAKKDDDELGENPYLAGFEWDRDECYTRFIVHQKRTGEEKAPSGKKKNKKDKIEE